MGIDTTHLTNHDLHFTHTDDFIREVEKRTGMPVFVEHYSLLHPKRETRVPENYKGWRLSAEDSLSLQEYFETGEMVELHLNTRREGWLALFVNTKLFEIRNDAMYMGRWRDVKPLVEWINDNGIPAPGDYAKIDSTISWIFIARQKRFESIYNLGAQHPKLISFCDDKNPDWLEYFFDEQWGMEEFINWGKEKLIHVKFSALVDFEFPEGEKNYDVFIEDDFEDLKNPDYKWVLPVTEFRFEASLENETKSQARQWITLLTDEAAQQKLSISAQVATGKIKGTVHFFRKDFEISLAEHLLQSFFNERGLKVSFL